MYKDYIILLLILALICISNFEYFYDLYSPSKTIKCLTDKPYNPEFSSNLYFKDRIKNMRIEYQTCDNYRCRTDKLNGYTANGNIPNNLEDKTQIHPNDDIHGLNPSYYDDPETFCKLNPTAYPCPNFWVNKQDKRRQLESPIKQPIQVKTYCYDRPKSTDLKESSKLNNFSIKEYKPRNLHELELCDVNDNQSALIIRPGLEDQALCGSKKYQ